MQSLGELKGKGYIMQTSPLWRGGAEFVGRMNYFTTHRYRGRRCQTLRHYGAQFGGLRVFPVIKIIVVCQVRKLNACTAGWAWKQSHAKNGEGREDRECICFAFAFCVCGHQKPEDPQIEPHGWRLHYTGRYRESGISPLYLCHYLISPLAVEVLSAWCEALLEWQMVG